MRIASIVFGSALLAGCAARQIPPTPTQAELLATGQSCDVDRVGEQEKTWREVSGDRFTFCVPVDWEAVGPRGQLWRSSTVDLSWGEAHDVFERATPFTNVLRGRGRERMGSRIVTESIGGHTLRLEIEDGEDAGSLRSAAQWLEPTLALYGTARTASASREIIAAFRSVRFTARRP